MVLFAIINLAKLPPYLALGQFPDTPILTMIGLIAIALVGTWAGSRLTRIIPERGFFLTIQIALFVLSVQLIYQALPDLVPA